MRGKRRLSILCVCALLVPACSDSDKSRESASKIEEEHLFRDSFRAAPALIQRLRDVVQMRGGVLMVEGEFDSYLLPQNSPWIVHCGSLGIRVIFGNPIGPDESGRNDVTVVLTTASVEKAGCRELAPVVGKELQTIVFESGSSSSHSANKD